jgi:hypothetical protein
MTPDEINALPDRVRRYIMMLETDADPSGTIRSEMHLREQCEALELRVNELRMAIEQALCCTPSVRDGAIIYDCGNPWEILRAVL